MSFDLKIVVRRLFSKSYLLQNFENQNSIIQEDVDEAKNLVASRDIKIKWFSLLYVRLFLHKFFPRKPGLGTR